MINSVYTKKRGIPTTFFHSTTCKSPTGTIIRNPHRVAYTLGAMFWRSQRACPKVKLIQEKNLTFLVGRVKKILCRGAQSLVMLLTSNNLCLIVS